MRFGFVASVLFHLCIVGAVVVWGRDWGSNRDYIREAPIPIELISEAKLADVTNVPATTAEPDITEPAEPEIPDDPVPVDPEPIIVAEADIADVAPPPPPPDDPEPEEVQPEEPEVVEEPKPEPPKEEPKPDPPKPKPVVKPEKPKSEGLDLDALSDLAKQAKTNETRNPSETPGAQAGDQTITGNAGGELTASTRALVVAAMKKCWNEPDGAPNPETLVVEMTIRLNRDGTLAGRPKIDNDLRISVSNNRFWKVARDEAVRAAYKCQPYTFLLDSPYEQWREIPLTLIPG